MFGKIQGYEVPRQKPQPHYVGTLIDEQVRVSIRRPDTFPYMRPLKFGTFDRSHLHNAVINATCVNQRVALLSAGKAGVSNKRYLIFESKGEGLAQLRRLH